MFKLTVVMQASDSSSDELKQRQACLDLFCKAVVHCGPVAESPDRVRKPRQNGSSKSRRI